MTPSADTARNAASASGDCVNEKGLMIPLLNNPTMPGAVAPGAVGARRSADPITGVGRPALAVCVLFVKTPV